MNSDRNPIETNNAYPAAPGSSRHLVHTPAMSSAMPTIRWGHMAWES